MCHFMFLAEMGGPRWVLMGMAVKVAQSVGTLITINRTHAPKLTFDAS